MQNYMKFTFNLNSFNIKLLIFIASLTVTINNLVFAQSTTPQYFQAALSDTYIVEPGPSILNATINASSGVFSNALQPFFNVTSNNESGAYLTQSWSCNTSGGSQNAIFAIGSQPYLILTNNSYPTDVASVNNIKAGSLPGNNPNAIAYIINAPPNIPGQMDVNFDTTTNTWKLHLLKNTVVQTSQTIPASNPLMNTFSTDDRPGNYQAIVTLSFDP